MPGSTRPRAPTNEEKWQGEWAKIQQRVNAAHEAGRENEAVSDFRFRLNEVSISPRIGSDRHISPALPPVPPLLARNPSNTSSRPESPAIAEHDEDEDDEDDEEECEAVTAFQERLSVLGGEPQPT